jgi:hypothetical protein
MTTEAPAAVTRFEDASAARWLTRALAPARARVRQQPSAAALERIRARIFGTEPKRTRTLAA